MTRQASKCVFQICYTLIKESTRSRITGDAQILFFLVSIKLNHENLWHNFTSFMFKYILTCRVSSLPRQVLKVSVTPKKCPPLDLKVGTPLPLKKKCTKNRCMWLAYQGGITFRDTTKITHWQTQGTLLVSRHF